MADTVEGASYDLGAIDISGEESGAAAAATETAAEASPETAANGQAAGSKGKATWLTVLTKGMRDSVEDPERFATVSDYIAYLQNEIKARDGKAGAATSGEDGGEFDKAWEDYAGSLKKDGGADESVQRMQDGVLAAFKAEKVPAGSAKAILDAVAELGKAQQEEMQARTEESRKKALKEYTSTWGKTEAARKAVLTEYDRGMKDIQKMNPKLFDGLVRQGLHTNPQVMELVLMMARAKGEALPPAGTGAGSSKNTVSRYNLTF